MKSKLWMIPLAALCIGAIGCQTNRHSRDLPVRGLDYSNPRGRTYADTTGQRTGERGKPPYRSAKAAQAAAGEGDWANVTGYRQWRYIVIHHSASDKGSAAIFDAEHRGRGWNGLGYHFVINNGNGGPDGRVEVGYRWRNQGCGAHCGKSPGNAYNEYGIGICLVGNFNNYRPTSAQIAKLNKLVAYLCAKYSIPPERVVGHRDAPNASTQCPGRQLESHLRGPLRSSLSSYAKR